MRVRTQDEGTGANPSGTASPGAAEAHQTLTLTLTQICRALRHLASDDVNQLAIASAGGIVSLISLIQSGTEGQKKEAAAALANLAASDANRVAIASAGGIAPLIKLVQSGADGQKEH